MSQDRPNPADAGQDGVLSSLPRHRPGRASSKRAGGRPNASDPSSGTGAATANSELSEAGVASGGDRKPARGDTGGRRAAPRRAASGSARSRPARLATAADRDSAHPQEGENGAPRQGYESDERRPSSAGVEPPTRLELLGSVAELATEGAEQLGKAGLSAGRGMLKAAAKLLPGG